MKYLDKVIITNSDNESYHKGYKLELTKLEVTYIKSALKMASEKSTEPLSTEFIGLKDKLKTLELQASKCNVNIEL